MKEHLYPNRSTAILLVLAFFFSFSLISTGQTPVGVIFERNRQGLSIDKELDFLFSNNSLQSILDNIRPFLDDKDVDHRLLALRILQEAALRSADGYLMRNSVYQLVNTGLRDVSPSVVYHTLNLLNGIPITSFDEKAQNNLASIILNSPPHFKFMIRLAARIGMQQLIPFFEEKLTKDSLLSVSDRWNLQIVLGRMGDQQQVEQCIQTVRQIGMNDEVVYRLVPDLIFMHHPLVVEFLAQELLKENMNCTSPDPDNEAAIDCGFRLAEIIAPHVVGFPVKVDASGDLDTDDYPGSLRMIREWIKLQEPLQVEFSD